ncbi:hypothetical protein EST38_g11464 [Candolleomyces aberdarensis]|uniref:galacturonan 1,4-alpha-galacturonidase n=1 Tax=Candolleomyces aberdarensis TaxID=2316362 RepID=A0A4V1Q2A3_9AGAR|nr:hypothetical protein EST38_g11464 [Candolleomyces aberdarensis]
MARGISLSLPLLYLALLCTSNVFNIAAAQGTEADCKPRANLPEVGECIVESADDPRVDDSPAILATFQRCSSNSVIRFLPTNYTVHTPISLIGLQKVKVLFYGNFLLPDSISEVQSAINTTQNPPSTYATPWIYIQGSDVSIEGSTQIEYGRFYGFGEQWWHSGTRTLRPQLATFNVTNGFLSNLKVIKPIAWGWNLPGQNIRVENHFVDAKPDNATRDDTQSFPFNTYYDQDKGPRPDNTNQTSTNIRTFTFKNIVGSLGTNWTDGSCISNPCWNYVPGLDEPKAVILDLLGHITSGH